MLSRRGCRAHIQSACFPNFETVAQTISAGAEMTIDILAATGANAMPAECIVVSDASRHRAAECQNHAYNP